MRMGNERDARASVGAEQTDASNLLYHAAMVDHDTQVNLQTDSDMRLNEPNDGSHSYQGGAYGGSYTYNGKVYTTNTVNPDFLSKLEATTGKISGTSILHEASAAARILSCGILF